MPHESNENNHSDRAGTGGANNSSSERGGGGDRTARAGNTNGGADRAAKASSKDILPLLKGWDYEPGTINVRKINGLDGRPKLQMRLDLGLLQMEMTGRPDGQKPHGFDSLLEYYEDQLREHQRTNGSEL